MLPFIAILISIASFVISLKNYLERKKEVKESRKPDISVEDYMFNLIIDNEDHTNYQIQGNKPKIEFTNVGLGIAKDIYGEFEIQVIKRRPNHSLHTEKDVFSFTFYISNIDSKKSNSNFHVSEDFYKQIAKNIYHIINININLKYNGIDETIYTKTINLFVDNCTRFSNKEISILNVFIMNAKHTLGTYINKFAFLQESDLTKNKRDD